MRISPSHAVEPFCDFLFVLAVPMVTFFLIFLVQLTLKILHTGHIGYQKGTTMDSLFTLFKHGAILYNEAELFSLPFPASHKFQ